MTTVGVREFRQDLADYIDGDEPVTVTRHGRRVGVFVPTRSDESEAIAAFREAGEKIRLQMEEKGLTEDGLLAEIEERRKANRRNSSPAQAS